MEEEIEYNYSFNGIDVAFQTDYGIFRGQVVDTLKIKLHQDEILSKINSPEKPEIIDRLILSYN